MARFSSSGVAIFAMIIVESLVNGEKLSLRGIGNSEPSPNSALLDDEAPAPITKTDGMVASAAVEQRTGFGTVHGLGAPNFGFGAEVDGALADKHLAAAHLASSGARKGPRLALAGAEIASASPGPRSGSAESSVTMATLASTGTQSFGAQAWANVNRVVQAASTPQTWAARGPLRRFEAAEPAITTFLVVGLLVLLAGCPKP